MNFDERTRFEQGGTFTPSHFTYIVEHFHVLNKNMMPFLEFWNIDRIAKAGCLHDMFGKVRFGIHGYNNDKRELFEVPEVRVFLRELADEWPYFFYAADLEDRFLDTLIKCLVQHITVIRAPNISTDYQVAVRGSEVNAICEKFRVGLIRAVSMDSRMNQADCDARVIALQNYVTKPPSS